MTTTSARLLIAYDGSENAAAAVRAAAGLFGAARAYVATVPQYVNVTAGAAMPLIPGVSPTTVHETMEVLEGEARREAGETAQQGVDEARALGLEAEVAPVGTATPAWTGLLDAAHQVGAEAVVCGTRGRGTFARALLGSTSSSLLHNTDLPLLVVPDGDGAFDGPVIAAYDGSDGATHAIEVAGALLPGRAAVVVHAWESVMRRIRAPRALGAPEGEDVRAVVENLDQGLADAAAAATRAGVDAAQAAGLHAEGEMVRSDDGAWRVIAAAAQRHGASVIAVGSRGLGAARSALLGSVSSGLIQNAELPVLVVPDR